MNRRAVRAGVAVAVVAAAILGTAAATGVLGGDGKPVGVKAARAVGNESDVRCHLTEDVVSDHPVLAEVLSTARERPVLDWTMQNVSADRADDIVSHLEYTCETTGGIYVYQNETFFVSFPIHDPTLAEELHDGDGHDH